METKKKWYQGTPGIIVFLIFFFPVGLYLMWKHANWSNKAKWIITGIFVFFFLINWIGMSRTASTIVTNPQSSPPAVNQQPESTSQPVTSTEPEKTPEPTKAPVKAANTPSPVQAKPASPSPAPVSNASVSQQNALKKAKSYLDYTAFSHDGLVSQLEYEQFSHADAVYGADNSGANWNEQAAKKAKSYMDYSAFSRGSLIDQLKYDKFTQEQAEYGANAVGL